MVTVIAEDLNFFFGKEEKLRITIIFSMHWKNLRKIITDRHGYDSQHFRISTLTWFNGDSQPDSAVLHMPTIMLANTALLPYRKMSIDSVSGDGVDKPSATNRIP